MAGLEIVQGNIAETEAHAVVNAWNRNFIPQWLLIPQGVSKALKKSAGKAPFRELATRGVLDLGEVCVTTAGEMPCEYMLHAATLHAWWTASEKSVRLAADNVFDTAQQLELRSMAIPLLGAGTGAVSPTRSFELIRSAWDAAARPVELLVYVYADDERQAISRLVQ